MTTASATTNNTPTQLSLELSKKIPMFRGFSGPEWERLMRIAELSEVAPGELIITQGEHSQRLWVLLEGTCEVFLNSSEGKPAEPTTLATLEPYANFGEMSFFHPAPHSASVRAKSAVKLLSIDRSHFESLCNQEASAACKLALNAVASLAERLRRMDEWVDELVHRGQAAQRIPEWNRLRATLFDGWKL
ncbi:MAG TPA: cyclic nucleotide-binding domain-containing protein [Pirellulales bacterium]|jgi:CRP-like cAMP-binding protein|nr:cyclic nucleotide-binding domain-containing protein [Pirellulales bacterium]